MEQKLTEKAIALFQNEFGQQPANLGYPVIDIYPKQCSYLYAQSVKAAEAYKTQQNILNWIMRFYLFPLFVNVVIGFTGMCKFQNFTHPLVMGTIIFFFCWVILLLVLWHLAAKADKKHRGKVIWLNY